MQTSKTTVAKAIYCLGPLFIGAFLGVLAGSFCLVADWLIDFDFSELQRLLTFFGFTLLGSLFGVIDTISRTVNFYNAHQRRKKNN